MTKDKEFSPLLRLLIAGACIVIIIAGIKTSAPLLNPFLLALLLAQSISPLPRWLMQKRIPPVIAVLLTILVVIVGGSAVISLFAASTAQFIQKLPTYETGLSDLKEAINTFLAARGLNISQILSFDVFSPSQLATIATTLVGVVSQVMSNALLIIFIVILLLFEFATIHSKSVKGKSPDGTIFARLNEFSADTVKYVAITGASGLLQAIANVIVLMILNVDFAVTWGVLFFFLNFVPTFGFLIAIIPPALIALLQYGWKIAVMVIAAWWLINFVGDNIIKPKFMKKGFDISLLLVIISVIFWSWVLGPIGAILAIPLTLTIKKMLQGYKEVKGS